MNLPDAPIAKEGFYVAHFLTVKDLARSRDFYVTVLGGKVIREHPIYIKLANSWIILNFGGGPTPDKPEVFLEPPRDLNTFSSFLNLRVADIWACYEQWKAKGAHFLTEPLDNHGHETRCYMRDPDGYIIEVGQYTQVGIDGFKQVRRTKLSKAGPKRHRIQETHPIARTPKSSSTSSNKDLRATAMSTSPR